MSCPHWNELTIIQHFHNELSAAAEAQLQAHLEICRDCRERFELTWEIILDDSSSSNIEEDEDIARLLASPLWQQHKEQLVQQQVNNIIQLQNQQPVHTDATTVSLAQQKQHQPSYRTMMMKIAAMVVLVLLPAAFSYYLLFKPAIEKSHPIMGSATSIAEPTRYERLDKYIDLYLAALQSADEVAASQAIRAADLVAEEMAIKTGDLVGRDTVNYYLTYPIREIALLKEARKTLIEIEATTNKAPYSASLAKARQAANLFTEFAAYTDVERTNILIAKYLVKTGQFEEADVLIKDNITRSVNAKHLFYQAQFLAWQGNRLANSAQFNEATILLKDSIEVARDLEVPQFLAGPSMVLAGIYFVTDNNSAAFELARKTLEITRPINHPYTIQLLQIAGISGFNLDLESIAESYLKESITLSEKYRNTVELVKSHAFLGIVEAEKGQTVCAENHFTIAIEKLASIEDISARKYAATAVMGYYARAQMLAGNNEQAINLYSQAIKLAHEANIKQKLTLSQLHQGLAEGLLKKGDRDRAETELSLAATLASEARKNSEYNNDLLTFAFTRKNSHNLTPEPLP
ncbi:MAG: zf-HC2 domain-containing protein [Acidobacteriota bacterium]